MNSFTTFQKEVIDKIIERKISDIYSFLEVMKLCTIRNYGWAQHKGVITPENVNECNYVYELNETTLEELKIQISEFISICNFLERESYIYAFPIKTRIFKPIVKFQSETEIDNVEAFHFYAINQLIFSRSLYEFFPSPELGEFKKRNYLTYSQNELLKESEGRKKAQFWTKIVAVSSIFFGLITILLQIIFSGIERDVNIKNDNAFKDSLKIHIIEQVKKPDSTQLKSGSVNPNP